MGDMVDRYCESFAKAPKRITLDIDDTIDAVHGVIGSTKMLNSTTSRDREERNGVGITDPRTEASDQERTRLR
jgi:hypothetical protein